MGRKVAIYARVSTEHEAQLSALENQIQYYDNILSQHPDWELYDRYIDEGITGTSIKKRKNFMRMLQDAENGCFSLIITREVSRFARNTVDTLQETRKLKKMNVEVYFTEDNIWTFKDDDGELKLTIMATLAQNESKKTSQRVKAGQKISFENGVFYGNGNILGYDKVGKDMVINEEQAEIVRFIFKSFLEGNGSGIIKYQLEQKGCLTSTGLKRWTAPYVTRVLQNPFYCGTIVYRKSYIPDYLEQKAKRNCGEVEKVVVQGRHEPIISKEDFEKVQKIIKSRRVVKDNKVLGSGVAKNLWGKILVCECGTKFQRRKYHTRPDGSISYCYQCYKQIRIGSKRTRIKRGLDIEDCCTSPLLAEWKLYLVANCLYRDIFKDKDIVVEELNDILDNIITEEKNNDIYTEKLKDIERKIENESQSLDKLLNLYLKGIIDEKKYVKKKDESDIILRKLIKEKEQFQEEKGLPKEELDKRISKIKKKIIDYANYADENISDNIIDEFTNKIIVYNDHLDWYLACLDELKETNGPLNSFHEVLFVEVTITEDEVENFKQNNPEYVKIRLSEPLKINVYI